MRYLEVTHTTAAEIDIDAILHGFNFIKISNPCFIGHDLETHMVAKHNHTIREFKNVCDTHALVYVHRITHSDAQKDECTFHYFAIKDEPKFPGIDEIETGKELFDQAKLTSAVEVMFKYRLEEIQELIASFGQDDIAKRLGLAIINHVANRHLVRASLAPDRTIIEPERKVETISITPEFLTCWREVLVTNELMQSAHAKAKLERRTQYIVKEHGKFIVTRHLNPNEHAYATVTFTN